MEQALVSGLIGGLLIALVALGLTLVFAVNRFINASHGSLITFGAYFCLAFLGMGFEMWAAVVAAILCSALLSIAVRKIIFEPLDGTGAVSCLVASVGAMILLEAVVGLVWGYEIRSFGLPVRQNFQIAGGVVLPVYDIFAGIAAILGMLGVWSLLGSTSLGRSMRAVADNPMLAELSGVSRHRALLATWGISGALVGLGGVSLGLHGPITPLVGWNMLLAAFAAAIVGGLGNVWGTIAGGILLGVAMELATLLIDATYKPVGALVVILIVLLIRPQGLFARAERI